MIRLKIEIEVETDIKNSGCPLTMPLETEPKTRVYCADGVQLELPFSQAKQLELPLFTE